RRRHTRWPRDWSSDVCSSDLECVRIADYFARAVREGSCAVGENALHQYSRWLHAHAEPTDAACPATDIRDGVLAISSTSGIQERSEERRVGKGGPPRKGRYEE